MLLPCRFGLWWYYGFINVKKENARANGIILYDSSKEDLEQVQVQAEANSINSKSENRYTTSLFYIQY